MTTVEQTIGPGTEMKLIFSQLGIYPRRSCECNARAAQMDEWGVEGCREHRQEIADWLREQMAIRKWPERLRHLAAGTIAIVKGDVPWLDLSDIPGSLVAESIRRAERKQEILARDTATSP